MAPRSFSDYELTLPTQADMPAGVELLLPAFLTARYEPWRRPTSPKTNSPAVRPATPRFLRAPLGAGPLEQRWEENVFTAEGALLHEKAHSGAIESRPGALVRRTLPLHCFRLGLSGQADIVEFLPCYAGPRHRVPSTQG